MEFGELMSGMQEIWDAFTTDSSVWWVLTPVFILWVLMELYFGEYKQERLGFSSALANGVSLAWVSVTSLRLYTLSLGVDWSSQFVFLILFLLYGVLIMWASFRHQFSERHTALLASPTIIYFFSTLSVLWGQQLLSTERNVMVALVVVFAIIYAFFWLLKKQLGFTGELEVIRQAGRHDRGAKRKF